jgi:hypothetical protein
MEERNLETNLAAKNDTTTHSREEEEGGATATQLEISNDSEHRGV